MKSTENRSVVGDLVEQVLQEKEDLKLNEDIFFRGEARKNYHLIPTLLRDADKYEKSVFERENDIYRRTVVMAADELNLYKSSWQKIALFQHFNLPTRLLDWSSSLITAIMFAIEPCLECKLNCHHEKCCKRNYNPRLWILDPKKMHNELHADTLIKSFVAVTIGVDDRKIKDYEQVYVTREEKEWNFKNGPVFMEIPWINPRIRAQKGFFTFHDNSTPLEEIDGHENWLSTIEIEKDLSKKLKNEILTIGANEYDLYPDITHLSKYFERKHRKVADEQAVEE